MSAVFAGIDMRDTAAASHATETIAEEDSSEVPQEDEERHVNKTLIAGVPRKKASSVSFSSDLEREGPSSTSSAEVVDKPESKRAKVQNTSIEGIFVAGYFGFGFPSTKSPQFLWSLVVDCLDYLLCVFSSLGTQFFLWSTSQFRIRVFFL